MGLTSFFLLHLEIDHLFYGTSRYNHCCFENAL
jgi:hypothetical protein